MDKIFQREGFLGKGLSGRREGNAVRQFTKIGRPALAQMSSRPTLPDSFHLYEWILDNELHAFIVVWLMRIIQYSWFPSPFVGGRSDCAEPVHQRHPPPRNG